MAPIHEILTPNYFMVLFVSAIICLVVLVALCLNRRRSQVYESNVVVLHQFKIPPKLPSLSPFCLKLEAYLKLNNIKYINELSSANFSKKGLMPWITYNNEDVADSQFCIDYLNKKFNIDMNSWMTSEERAIAKAFRYTIEEAFRFCLGLERWVYQGGNHLQVPWIIRFIFKRRLQSYAHAQGFGRHSREQVYGIAKGIIKSLSDYIGNKKYLMGEKVCEEDTIIFAMLAELMYYEVGELHKYTLGLPNLVAYVNRLKDQLWPDWKPIKMQ